MATWMSFDRPTRLAMTFLAVVFCLGALNYYDGRSLEWAPSKALEELSGDFADLMPSASKTLQEISGEIADLMPNFKLPGRIGAFDAFKTFTPELVFPEFPEFQWPDRLTALDALKTTSESAEAAFRRFTLEATSHSMRTIMLSMVLCCVLAAWAVPEEKPTLEFKQTERNRRIACDCPGINRFKPTPWALSGHAQSLLFAAWVGGCKNMLRLLRDGVRYKRELICLPDGGTIALDHDMHFGGEDAGDPRPVLLVLSGVLGDRHNPYVKHLVLAARTKGWRAVVKSWRGIQVELTSDTPELWGVKCVEDVAACVARLQEAYPRAPLMAAGFSYGGHVLQTYMATRANACPLVGAVTFSSLFDTVNLRQGKWPPYNFANTTMCINVNWQHLPTLGKALGKDLQAEIRRRMPPRLSTRTPDLYHDIVSRHFTQPPCASGKHFLEQLTEIHTSSLSNIKKPVLCLMAADDPLCPPATAIKRATAAARLSDSTFMLRTRRGGHCGWFEGMTAHSWADNVAVEFLTAALKHTECGQR